MTRISFSTWLAASPSKKVFWLAALVIAVPPLVLVTWLPFLDLVAYVGLNSFPAKLSAGPLHFAVFQLTYIVHYAITRFMGDLGIPLPLQIKLLYLLQAGVFFTIIWRCLEDLIADPWLRSLGIAVGALAFLDGLFIWGGPLAFSLAAVALAGATFITLHETTAVAPSNGKVALLAFLSVLCHPFALPFALLLGALRLIFVRLARWSTVGWLAGLLVLGWAIRNDSTEGATAAQLSVMIALDGAEMGHRFTELFVMDQHMLAQLFGTAPGLLALYLMLVGVVRCAGFVTAPVVAILAKDSPRLRMLMSLDAILALLYFTSTDRSPIIPWWPQRILTFNSCFIFVAGLVGPLFLMRRFWPQNPVTVADRRLRPVLWAAPVMILGGLALAQVPLFRLGDKIGASLDRSRASILRSQVSGAFLKVSNLDAIQPFYLRCVPFLLFSDSELVAKNLIFFTEWHYQLRHPTRVVENWFDLGRPRFLAQFYATDGTIDVRLERSGEQTFPVATNISQATRLEADQVPQAMARYEGQLGNDLLSAGCARDAIEHFRTALQVNPGLAEIHYNLAVALAQTGHAAEAMEHLDAAIRAKPAFVEAFVQRGTLLLSAARHAEAIDQFRAALQLDPNHPMAHFYLGFVLAQTGKAPEAIENYRAAIEANPQLFEARFNLAQLLHQSGQDAEAAMQLQIAVKLRPDDADARAALEHLVQQ